MAGNRAAPAATGRGTIQLAGVSARPAEAPEPDSSRATRELRARRAVAAESRDRLREEAKGGRPRERPKRTLCLMRNVPKGHARPWATRRDGRGREARRAHGSAPRRDDP